MNGTRWLNILASLFALSYFAGGARAQDFSPATVINACGTMAEFGNFVEERATEQIAAFGILSGKDATGEPEYALSFMMARPDRSEWYLILSDHNDLESLPSADARLCVLAAGNAIELLDHTKTRRAHENPSGVRTDEGVDVPQGWLHNYSREKAREEWRKLKSLGQMPSGKNPNILEVLGFQFDFSNSEMACEVAEARWSSEYCYTYEERIFFLADYSSQFPFLRARGFDKDKDEFLLTFLAGPEGKLRVLKTTPEGATVSGFGISSVKLFAWAKSQVPGITDQ